MYVGVVWLAKSYTSSQPKKLMVYVCNLLYPEHGLFTRRSPKNSSFILGPSYMMRLSRDAILMRFIRFIQYVRFVTWRFRARNGWHNITIIIYVSFKYYHLFTDVWVVVSILFLNNELIKWRKREAFSRERQEKNRIKTFWLYPYIHRSHLCQLFVSTRELQKPDVKFLTFIQ